MCPEITSLTRKECLEKSTGWESWLLYKGEDLVLAKLLSQKSTTELQLFFSILLVLELQLYSKNLSQSLWATHFGGSVGGEQNQENIKEKWGRQTTFQPPSSSLFNGWKSLYIVKEGTEFTLSEKAAGSRSFLSQSDQKVCHGPYSISWNQKHLLWSFSWRHSKQQNEKILCQFLCSHLTLH